MTQFRTREEYERWRAAREGSANPPARTAPVPGAGVDQPSIAKIKPKRGLVIGGALVMMGSSVFLFASGDMFSGAFVLLLGAFIAAVYMFFRLRPHLDDAEYVKTTVGAIATTALRHGHVSQNTVEGVKKAEEAARTRYASEQAKNK